MKTVIIGGGIVGVSALLTLAEAGSDAVLIERSTIAGAASGRNAGVIGGGGWGDDPDVMVALRMGSRDRYVDLTDDRGHDIGLERAGTLTLIRTEQEWNWAARTVEADRARGHSFELLDTDELRAVEPAADHELLGAIFDPLAARAEPVAATLAFAAEAQAAGATIATDTAVTDMRPVPGGGWEVDTIGTVDATVGADAVVIAAGPWCAEIGAMVGLDIPIVGVRGQMWATAEHPPLLRHVIAAAESPLDWSNESERLEPPDLTHRDGRRTTRHVYGCQRPNGEIVFGGDRVLTSDPDVDDTGIAINHAHVGELLPAVASMPVVRTWAGSMPFSLDGRPLIGPIPDHEGLHLAGGLASGGFGRGPMAGRLIADLVLGIEPAFDLAPVLPAGRLAS